MTKYELVYIVDAHAPQTTKDEIAKQLNDAMVKSQVKLVNSQIWMDRQRIAFPINKVVEGTYYLLNCEATSNAVNKLQSLMRINEQILRFLVIRLDEQKA